MGKYICDVCGNQEGDIYSVKERQLNKGEVFDYYYCNECGTLQLAQNVKGMGNYYPNNYYSFEPIIREKSSKVKRTIRKILISYISNCSIPTKIKVWLWKNCASYMYFEKTHLNVKAKILDVGCGSGNWLYVLSECGFENLYGIDLFCKKSPYENIISYKMTDIFDSGLEKYDLVTFHHSFEHMQEPLEVLKRVKELLVDKGVCIIRIPVNECEAWKRFKEDWYQIDAPRHFYLYTERAISLLAKKAGMYLERVVYDSQPTQFVYSEYYKNTNLSLEDIVRTVGEDEIKKYQDLTDRINVTSGGDQAIFYLKKETK